MVIVLCILNLNSFLFFYFFQTDLFGQNVINFTHPDDHAFLQRQLIPTDLENLFDIPADANVNSEPKPRSQEEEDEIDRKLRADKRRFTIR